MLTSSVRAVTAAVDGELVVMVGVVGAAWTLTVSEDRRVDKRRETAEAREHATGRETYVRRR
jgi:hypothetical protein